MSWRQMLLQHHIPTQLWKSRCDSRNRISWKIIPPLKANEDLCHFTIITASLPINVEGCCVPCYACQWGISTPSTSFCGLVRCFPFLCGSFGNPFLLNERLTCYWLHLRLLRWEWWIHRSWWFALEVSQGGYLDIRTNAIIPFLDCDGICRELWLLSKKLIILSHQTNSSPSFINQQWVHESEKIIVAQKLISFNWNTYLN